MTFSQVQRDAEMHDDAVQVAMQQRRPMGYLGDSWSGDGRRREMLPAECLKCGKPNGPMIEVGADYAGWICPECMTHFCPVCNHGLYLNGTTWTCSNCPFTMERKYTNRGHIRNHDDEALKTMRADCEKRGTHADKLMIQRIDEELAARNKDAK